MQMIQKFNNGFMNIIKQIYKISYDFSGELHSLHTTLNSPRYTEKHREEILKIKSDTKVLVVTALTKDGTSIQAIKKGAKGFITKPFTVEQMKEAFTRILN